MAALLCCAAASAQQAGARPGTVAATPSPLTQTLTPPPFVPGRDRPLPEAAPTPDLDFTIEAPRRSPVPRAVEELTFDVKDVRVTGMTRYGQDVIRPLAQPVIGQTVHLSDLIAIAEKLEERYHQDGYVLTRVFVPTQSVNDGIFQITVVEGYVSAVAVQGDDPSTRERVEKLMMPITQVRPLTLSALESALLTANKLPGVAASGLLRPSPTEPGASELVVTVRELPISGGVAVDNMGSANTGYWTIAADATAPSPIGDGGQISLNASVDPADPKTRYSAGGKYTAPLPLLDGLVYSLTASGSHGEPGGTVSDLNLITNSTTFGAQLALPLIESREQELSVLAGFSVQSSDVKVQGLTATHDEWRVADLSLVYQNNVWADGITSMTLDLAQGVPGLGATPDSSVEKSGNTEFTKFTGLLRRTQAISGPVSAQLVLNGQYSGVHPVLGEEISFGGQLIGRGYDPGAVTGDMGVGGAFELQYTLNPSWFYSESAQIYGFYDAGQVWNHAGPIDGSIISSAGGGIRLTLPENVLLNLMFGTALRAVPGSDEGKHTSRVMVNTAIRF